MQTVRLDAKKFADHDNDLAAAEQHYASKHGLEGWDLSPRYEDDQREVILLTVPEDVTDERIRGLARSAGEAGDSAQVALCDRALSGDEVAYAACVRAIRATQAME